MGCYPLLWFYSKIYVFWNFDIKLTPTYHQFNNHLNPKPVTYDSTLDFKLANIRGLNWQKKTWLS
jgi:hypothetical protein